MAAEGTEMSAVYWISCSK